jgi:hypothetical protein
MKKIILSAALFVASFTMVAQVGIGNTDPKATLDVNLENYTTGDPAGIAVTQLTGFQIEAMDTTDLKPGTLVYSTSGLFANIVISAGYWYYNGTTWVALSSATDALWKEFTATNPDMSTVTGVSLVGATDEDFLLFNEDGVSYKNEYVEGTHNTDFISTKRIITTGVTSNQIVGQFTSVQESAANTADFKVINGSSNRVYKQGNMNGTDMYAGVNFIQFGPTASGDLRTVVANRGSFFLQNGNTVNITDSAIGIQSNMNGDSGTTGSTIENVKGMYIAGSMLSDAARSGKSRYGLQIEDVVASTRQTGGVTYAVHTGLGEVSLGDNLTLREYGAGTNAGTAAYALGVDTAGNVIEINASGSVDPVVFTAATALEIPELFISLAHENLEHSVNSTLNGTNATYADLENSIDNGSGNLDFNSGSNSSYTKRANIVGTLDAVSEEFQLTVQGNISGVMPGFTTVVISLNPGAIAAPNNTEASDAKYQVRVSSSFTKFFIDGVEVFTTSTGNLAAYKVVKKATTIELFRNGVSLYETVPVIPEVTTDVAAVLGALVIDNGNVGLGIIPEAKLHINGSVIIGDTAAAAATAGGTCSKAGEISFNGTNFFGCNGTTWSQLDN